jgi:hypothetical protein
MKSIRLGVLASAVAAGVAVALGSLGSAAATTGHDRHGATFTLVERTTASTSVDTDRSGGESVGDMSVFESDFLAGGKKVGTVEGFCIIISDTLWDCQATGSLAGGGIRSAGRFDVTAETNTVAIVGGTGIYGNAGGQITITAVTDESETDTFEVTNVKRA